MRFTLVDHIIDLQPGVKITAVKVLSMAEEYLADHFPHFPVIPGVLMLEAMTQAGAWLIRATEDFKHSMVVLKQASSVKYAQFLEPGQKLVVTAEIVKDGENETKIKAWGEAEGRTIVSGRLVLKKYNLGDINPAHRATDEATRQDLRKLLNVLYQPPAAVPNAI
jgi:3-hydroxyacyl-[acyl-carrier-protein] dehydratase